MLSTTATAVPAIRHARARALCVAAGVLTAVVAWVVEVPILGIHLNVSFGAGHMQTTIVAGQVIGASLVASLLGWLLLAVLERHTPRARALWTGLALLVLAVSVAPPLAAATTTSAAIGLVVIHCAVATAVIPALARTARAR